MSGAWAIVLQLLLPIPTVFLILLSIPTPRRIRRILLVALDKVLSLQFLSSIKLGQFLLFMAGVTFATAAWKCYELAPYNPSTTVGGITTLKIEYLATKWRLERNFWLSAFCFTMWIILNRYYTMALELLVLQSRMYDTPAPPSVAGDVKTSSLPAVSEKPSVSKKGD